MKGITNVEISVSQIEEMVRDLKALREPICTEDDFKKVKEWLKSKEAYYDFFRPFLGRDNLQALSMACKHFYRMTGVLITNLGIHGSFMEHELQYDYRLHYGRCSNTSFKYTDGCFLDGWCLLRDIGMNYSESMKQHYEEHITSLFFGLLSGEIWNIDRIENIADTKHNSSLNELIRRIDELLFYQSNGSEDVLFPTKLLKEYEVAINDSN